MPRKPPKPAPVVVKRTSHERKDRKRLAPELEAFARSDETRLRIKRPPVDRGKIDDPRESYAIPGVANRDARAVYSSRAHELVTLWNGGELDAAARAVVGERLLDIKRLALWRAMRVTAFAAIAEQVVGMKLAEAESLVAEAAERLAEPVAELNEREVALWLRTEAGLYEGDPNARAFLRAGSGTAVLSLSVPVTLASLALAGAGARHAPLARAQREEEGRPLEQPEREPPAAAGARLLRRRAPSEASREVQHESDADDEEMPSKPAEEERASPLRGRDKPREERPRPDGERPRFQARAAAAEGERPRFQARAAADGERPRFQARAQTGSERPRFQARTQTEGERPRSQERARPEGDRPRFQERSDRPRPEGRFEKQGDRPAFQKRGAAGKAGDRPAFQKRGAGNTNERPAFQQRGAGGKTGDRPAFQQRGAGGKTGDRPAFQKRGAGGKAGDRPSFGKKPPFKSGGQGKGFVKGKGFGERKPFGNGGDKKPFKKKPSDDEG